MKRQSSFWTFQNEAYTKTVTVDEYGKINNQHYDKREKCLKNSPDITKFDV